MKSLGIILDSFAGKTKKELDKDEYYYLPHYIYINNKEYIDGITISLKEMNTYSKNKIEMKTSLPSPKNVIHTFDKSSNKYDDVLYLTMGSAISGTYQSASLISKDYKNVTVMDNFIVGPHTFDMAILQAKKMYSAGENITKITKYLKAWNKKIFNLIIPIDIRMLYKGGRIGKSGTYLLSKAKIIPIIKYDSKNRVKWFKRTHKKAILKSIDMAKNYADTLEEKYDIVVGYSGEKSLFENVTKFIVEKFKVTKESIQKFKCPPVVIAHIGWGAFSISIVPKI